MSRPQTDPADMRSADEDRRSILLATGTLFAGRIVGRAAFFGTNVVIARAFGPDSFGLFAIGWSILSLFLLVAPLGLSQAVIRFAEPRRQSGDWPRFAALLLGLGALSSLALAVALALAAPVLADRVFDAPVVEGILLALAPAVVLRTLLGLLLAVCRATGDIRYQVIIGEIADPVLTFLLVLGVILAGLDLRWAAAMFSVASLFTLPFAFRAATSWTSNLAWPASPRGLGLREVLPYGFFIMLAHSATVLNMTVDRLILGVFAAPAEVGLYQAASQLSLATIVLLSSASTVFEVNAARRGGQDRVEELRSLSHDVNRWSAHVLVPLYILFLFLPGMILALAYGSEFRDGGQILAILTIGQFALIALGQSSTLMTMLGSERVWFRIIVSAVIVNILANLLLVPQFGAVGAAVATLIATVGQVAFAIRQVRRRIGFWPGDRTSVLGVSLAACASGGAVWLASLPLEGANAPLQILCLLLVSYGAYLICWAAYGLHRNDRHILSELGALLSGAGLKLGLR